MVVRKRHTEGFTVAEVLLAVAIILVLAAIAVPAIMTAQTNMRLVELDNAAAQIANAAQTQMTAKKANGTWLSLVEKTDDAGKATYHFPEAQNPPGGASADKRYMTADQARQNGIVPGLSIDDTVREGDYIIEFEATTASVIGVFYSDGKAGFFDSPHPETKAAQDYYAAHSADREQQARRQASPLIGYYEGTPGSATKAVALKNPVVSVSEEGKLLVQDLNIGGKGPNGAPLSTKADIVITKKDDPSAGFMIGGLDETAATYTISTLDGRQSLSLSNSGQTAIYELIEKTPTASKNAYSIDLNEFARIAQADETAQKNGLAALIAQFTAGMEIKVEAKVTSTTASIPATATAYLPWPAPVGKLTVLVSTPWSKALAEKDIGGGKNPDHLKADSYTQPTVKAATISNGPSQTITAQDEGEDLPFKPSQINTKLIGKNKQAGWQSYVGSSVFYSEAANDSTFMLKAQAGAYRSPESGKVHQYQVEELWVQLANGDCTRVGMVRNGTWEWVEGRYARLDLGLTWNDAAGNKVYDDIAGQSTEGIASISIRASEWGSAPTDLGMADADGNVVLFVRTAPSTLEVQAYFDDKAADNALRTELGEYSKISARGVNQTVNTAAGTHFESEFGVSSSDAAWTLAVDNEPGFDNGKVLAAERAAVRVYYALAPGLGFKNIQSVGDPLRLRSTEITNARLWVYLTGSNGRLEKQPAAQVRAQVAGAYYFTATGGATDFELNAVEDHRFYRAVTYYDEDGTTRLAIPAQYVPYTAMDSDSAVIAAGLDDKTVGDTEWQFVGWTTDEEGLLLQPGTRIADYDAQLSYKGVKLKATYKEKPKPSVGLMYLEFDGNGDVSGYYGSVDGSSILDGLSRDNVIDQWGYYVIVPTGAENPRYQAAGDSNNRYDWQKCALFQNAVQIGDLGVFDLYKAPTNNPGNRTVTIPFKDGSGPLPDWNISPNASPTYLYSYNFDFAAAVALNNTGVKDWGKDAPWMVRHFDQFPAMTESLKGYGSDIFKQGHDIDFIGRGMHIVGVPFAGKYNGNGFVIWNAPYERITQDYFTALGLIPRASGAEFINVHLRFTQGVSGQLRVTDGSDQGFGLLVGSAENSSFENCTVDGLLLDGASKLSPKLHFGANGYIGGIVGIGQNSELSNCAVANVEFDVVGIGNRQLGFGGLVGWFGSDSEIELEYKDGLPHTVVAGVRFVSTAKDEAAVGALAGFASTKEIEIEGNVVYSVLWVLSKGDQEVTKEVGKPI